MLHPAPLLSGLPQARVTAYRRPFEWVYGPQLLRVARYLPVRGEHAVPDED